MRGYFPEERVAWRRLWIGAGASVAVILVAMLLLRPAFGASVVIVQCAMQAIAAAIFIPPYNRARRARGAIVKESGYLFCPACGYDLRQTPAATRCPECGAAHSARDRELVWRDRYRFLESPWYGKRPHSPGG